MPPALIISVSPAAPLSAEETGQDGSFGGRQR